jgi:hypothetical protein
MDGEDLTTLFPISDKAQRLLAKFKAFVDRENFDQIEKEIMAERSLLTGERRPTCVLE